MITPDEFAEKIQKMAEDWDTEAAHAEADRLMVKILREWGFGKGCDIFEKMEKWYA